ncbi:uncharacterized protein LOC144206011 [Stigmatopora nigra]
MDCSTCILYYKAGWLFPAGMPGRHLFEPAWNASPWSILEPTTNRRGRCQSSNSRRQTPKCLMGPGSRTGVRACVRSLQSSSKVTIYRRSPAKLLTEPCCTFVTPQARTAGKHQECGQNDQKVAGCRRHNKRAPGFCLCTEVQAPPSMKFFKIKEFHQGDLVSAYEQIASGAHEVFQNKRIPPGGGEDSIFYDAGAPTGTIL